MGSSSPSTVTQTTQSIPLNAGYLQDLYNGTIDLTYNNPFSYPSFPTYAQPQQSQYDALNGAGSLGQSAGNAISPFIPQLQLDALHNNQFIANGGVNNATSSMSNALAGLGGSNPAASAISALTPLLNGSYYSAVQPSITTLQNLGTQSSAAKGLQGVGQGPITSGLLALPSGTAANALTKTANGDYLNSNPYLDAMYDAASKGITRAYQTATAPQTDSAFTAAGRTNSGAAANARSVNERNLGDTLSNLASNVYGTNYANERNLQNSAASALGNLQTNALTGAGSIANNAFSNLGTLDLNSLTDALDQYGNQFDLISNAASNAGSLGVSGNNSQANALNAAIGNYNTGVGLQQNAINQTPAFTNLGLTDWQALLSSGATQQQYNQAAINDQIQRFLGNQAAPWQTRQYEAQLLGGPISGTTTAQTPYFQPSGASQILGGLTGAASLGSTLFGPAGGAGLIGGKL
jgi:hypothetical protein